MIINSISDFRRAMRHGQYAWPGGYPCFFLMSDGEALSFEAAKRNKRAILAALAYGVDPWWRPIAFEVNWEDDSLFCCDSGEPIESAYCEA